MPSPRTLSSLAVLTALALFLPRAADAAPPNDCDRCFALVRADGTLIRHRNVSANFKIAEARGNYEIVFRYPIDRCAISTQVESRRGVVSTVYRSSTLGNPANRTASVLTTRPPLTDEDAPFSIDVRC